MFPLSVFFAAVIALLGISAVPVYASSSPSDSWRFEYGGEQNTGADHTVLTRTELGLSDGESRTFDVTVDYDLTLQGHSGEADLRFYLRANEQGDVWGRESDKKIQDWSIRGGDKSKSDSATFDLKVDSDDDGVVLLCHVDNEPPGDDPGSEVSYCDATVTASAQGSQPARKPCEGQPTIFAEDPSDGLQFDDCLEITKTVVDNKIYRRLLNETNYADSAIKALNDANRIQSIANARREEMTYDRFQMTLKIGKDHIADGAKMEEIRSRYSDDSDADGLSCDSVGSLGTVQGLFECMAQDIDIVESELMRDASNFTRCDNADCPDAYDDWEKTHEYGAPGSMFRIMLGPFNGEQANVVMTQRDISRSAGYFLVSTVSDKKSLGNDTHPVFGSREFGYLIAKHPNENDTYYVTFYTSTANKARKGLGAEDRFRKKAKQSVLRTWFGLMKGIKNAVWDDDEVAEDLGADPTLITYQHSGDKMAKVNEDLNQDQIAHGKWCDLFGGSNEDCSAPKVSKAIRYRKWTAADAEGSEADVEAAPYEETESKRPFPYHEGAYECFDDECTNHVVLGSFNRQGYTFTEDAKDVFPYSYCPRAGLTGPYKPDVVHCHAEDWQAFESKHSVTKGSASEPGPGAGSGARLTITSGETTSGAVSVFPGWDQFVAATDWGGSDIVMVLQSPSGRTIDRDTDADDVTHSLSSSSERYVVADPEPGMWRVTLHGAEVPPGGETVTVTTEGNLAPSAKAGGPYQAQEGTPVTLTAQGSGDPEGDPVTYRWDLDGDGAYDDGSGQTVDHTFGDNGDFTVGLQVRDDVGATATDTATVTVDNAAPTVRLDAEDVIHLPARDAFVGRKAVAQTHTANGTDPGSDDLTVAWSFAWPSDSAGSPTTTYFNDTGDPTGAPDPDPSPQGRFPFAVTDTAKVNPSRAGVLDVAVEVNDDDGGADTDSQIKLVTGDRTCTRSQGFWKHQTRDKGRQHVDEMTLARYLAITDAGSSVVSELTPATTISQAEDVLWSQGPSMRNKAEAQLLSAWLNISSGAIGWHANVDDTTAGKRIGQAEEILHDSDANHHDLQKAKDLTEAINLHDESTTDCDTDAGANKGKHSNGLPPQRSDRGKGAGN